MNNEAIDTLRKTQLPKTLQEINLARNLITDSGAKKVYKVQQRFSEKHRRLLMVEMEGNRLMTKKGCQEYANLLTRLMILDTPDLTNQLAGRTLSF